MKKKDTVLRIERVNKSFGNLQVLKDLNLTIKEGEFLTLLGPSGSGKTTLMLILAGMLDPTAGFVKVGDSRLDKLSGYGRSLYRRHKVGTLWQMT